MGKLKGKKKIKNNQSNQKTYTPRASKIDSFQLKGLAWCVKQAFSAYNGKNKKGEPKTNWKKPSASGEFILGAEEFLRKHVSDKEYFKIFKKKKGDEF